MKYYFEVNVLRLFLRRKVEGEIDFHLPGELQLSVENPPPVYSQPRPYAIFSNTLETMSQTPGSYKQNPGLCLTAGNGSGRNL